MVQWTGYRPVLVWGPATGVPCLYRDEPQQGQLLPHWRTGRYPVSRPPPCCFLSRQVSDSFLKNVLDTSLSKIGETLQQRAQTISYMGLYENNFLSNFELGSRNAS